MLKPGLTSLFDEQIAETFTGLVDDVLTFHETNAAQGNNTYVDLGEEHFEVPQLYAQAVFFQKLGERLKAAPSPVNLQISYEYAYNKFPKEYADEVQNGLSRDKALEEPPLIDALNGKLRSLVLFEMLNADAHLRFVDVKMIKYGFMHSDIDFIGMQENYPQFVKKYGLTPLNCRKHPGIEAREEFIMERKAEYTRFQKTPVLHVHGCGAEHISPLRPTSYPKVLHQYDMTGKEIAVNLNVRLAGPNHTQAQADYVRFLEQHTKAKPDDVMYLGFCLPEFSSRVPNTKKMLLPDNEVRDYWNHLCVKNNTLNLMY